MKSIASLYKFIFSDLLVFLLFFISTFYSGVTLSSESVKLDDSRSVIIMLPSGWQLIRMMSPPELPAKNINLVKDDYKILVTLIGSKGGVPLNMSDEKLVALINKTSMQYVPNSVQGKISINKIQNIFTRGGYASFTDKVWIDKQPPPGEYKHVTSGVLAIGDSIIASVTYLSNELEGEVFEEGLAIIKNLKLQE
ncbi:hypothetical protein KCM76_14100 [Zooshikella marina]|uniref:hypothetical protein n=1 Tax=Zooshikella ganghwensis TaxID=202772 RepID=UPI001BB05A58|nr:hypothetical protein [Zooshikella ganghwensis]MBU2707124.1 hypothetical protein [Zooshikella ganghwensis]